MPTKLEQIPFLAPQARAQLLPANPGFSRVEVEARFWFAGTKGSEARTLKN
jgi:hypothetical protein